MGCSALVSLDACISSILLIIISSIVQYRPEMSRKLDHVVCICKWGRWWAHVLFKLSPLTCSIFIALNPREISPGRGDLAPLPVKRNLQKLSVILSPRKPTNANEILRLEEDVFHTINLITTAKTKLIQRELDQARTTLCEMTSRRRMQDDMIKQLEALLEMRNIEGPVPEESQFEAVPYTYITGSDS